MTEIAPRLRRATTSDVEFLADVVLLSNEIRYARGPDWDPDTFRAGLVEDADDQVAGGPENSITYVITIDRTDVGRARIVTTDTHVEIAGLQVLPDFQNHGIGTAIIGQVTKTAAAADLPVTLDVETDNPGARRLYERLRFEPVGPITQDRQQMILRPPRPMAAAGSDPTALTTEQWARNELEALGRIITGPAIKVSHHSWSTVWRIPTDKGDVMIKKVGRARRHEGRVTAFASGCSPDQVDSPMAVDTENGRWLVPDRGLTLYAADPGTRGLDLDTVLALVTDYARLQRATIGHAAAADIAGLPRWDPSTAAHQAEAQAGELHRLPADDPRHISADQRDEMTACLPGIEEAGRHLAASPVPHCLDHGDLWPGNILPADSPERFRFIDFGGAAWTHPFLSMTVMVVECRHLWSVPDKPAGLNIEHPLLDRVLDTYAACWTDHASLADLRRTLDHALRLGALRRSSAWITNLADADEAALAADGHLLWDWLGDLRLPVLPSRAHLGLRQFRWYDGR
ncbi:MAG: GNAT family N-acetyltransferase [Propionibacteriales bacterium]|nr:GNAT family N-acetyltransferase [Propionibacteriales bacterium]